MAKKKTVVFKIEIETLYGDDGKVCQHKLEHLSMVCANMRNSGVNILLVSSGAIALGATKKNLKHPPEETVAKQAIAALGQAELIILYQDYFDRFCQIVAQVLITRDVAENPERNKNAKNTLARLLEKGVIPIINENDSVSTSDIIKNDNYPLVLITTLLTDADAIVVSTHQMEKFLLMVKDSSSVIITRSEELADIENLIEKENKREKNKIEGFPENKKFEGGIMN